MNCWEIIYSMNNFIHSNLIFWNISGYSSNKKITNNILKDATLRQKYSFEILSKRSKILLFSSKFRNLRKLLLRQWNSRTILIVNCYINEIFINIQYCWNIYCYVSSLSKRKKNNWRSFLYFFFTRERERGRERILGSELTAIKWLLEGGEEWAKITRVPEKAQWLASPGIEKQFPRDALVARPGSFRRDWDVKSFILMI